MLSAIIVAAGTSTRVGFDKLFAPIAGRPVVMYSIDAFEHTACVGEIIIVARKSATDRLQDLIAQAKIRKVRAIIPGGKRRQDSVQAGLNEISETAQFVAVHDAARPLITPREIERVFAEARKSGAAALAAPVSDTLKVGDQRQRVVGSIERSNVFAMQTPQIFARKLLVDSYRRATQDHAVLTDEVSAIQNSRGEVVIVPAEDHNLKITYASDLSVAENILAGRSLS